MSDERSVVPFDYEHSPERFLLGRDLVRNSGGNDGIHREVADRFSREGFSDTLDAGCGDGTLLVLLRDRGIEAVGLDLAEHLVANAPPPVVLGDARFLPFPDKTFDAAACLFVLYHLSEPLLAIRECYRVLRPGGLFAAAAPSREDSPELAEVLPVSQPISFDAEIGGELLQRSSMTFRWIAGMGLTSTCRIETASAITSSECSSRRQKSRLIRRRGSTSH